MRATALTGMVHRLSFNGMENNELIPHLFRTEFRKITSVLAHRMGIEHLETAEDIAGETFLTAAEVWPYKGIPPNPVAWLYTVAKNKAVNYLHRQRIFDEKIAVTLKTASADEEVPEIDLSEKNITDSQLQMLFAVCHPAVSAESQIALALRILCGFGIDEIAIAFLTGKDTINKRLFRAKEKLRQEKVKIEFPADHELPFRLEAVLTTLYLLFNEGYYSETHDAVLREDLCTEAMRLVKQLIDYDKTSLPETRALCALMCLQASRFPARKNGRGELILYADQDESLWDQHLISTGVYYLNQASTGTRLSRYHLEANIAYWYTIKTDTPEKWETILQLYNYLLQIAYSPIAAMNRTYALSKARNKEVAIIEAERLQLTTNHFYYMLLGELYTGIDPYMAQTHFLKALQLARTATDKQQIQKRIAQF